MADNAPEARQLVISSVLEGDSVQVSVSDAGMGIAQEAAETLCEPFFTTKKSGMGMGLAVSRAIIKAHGGRIWAVNNPDRGATFYFNLPLVRETPEAQTRPR
jgi:signal transduction histidine kinase